MSDTHDFPAVLAIMLIFGAPIAAWIISRVLAHQERMAMISRGIVPPPHGMRVPPPPSWAPGAVPPPPPSGKGGAYPAYDDYYYAQTQMRKGIRLALIGLALVIGLGGIGPLGHISYFGPWLLAGLIPMFIGIAQIVNAVLSGAQIPSFGNFGGHSGSANFGPPQGPGPTPGAAPPPPAGPYAWRPGSTPEIERPVPPPDTRR
ncbi:MAG TPA: hypothetical protein VIK27_06495 [Candidatus Aquilonibacter sp.]